MAIDKSTETAAERKNRLRRERRAATKVASTGRKEQPEQPQSAIQVSGAGTGQPYPIKPAPSPVPLPRESDSRSSELQRIDPNANRPAPQPQTDLAPYHIAQATADTRNLTTVSARVEAIQAVRDFGNQVSEAVADVENFIGSLSDQTEQVRQQIANAGQARMRQAVSQFEEKNRAALQSLKDMRSTPMLVTDDQNARLRELLDDAGGVMENIDSHQFLTALGIDLPRIEDLF